MEKRLLIRNTNHINFENLKQTLIAIQNYKESINGILGIFPFLWFCELFSTTCLRLTYLTINKQDPELYYVNLIRFSEYISICLINLTYVLVINYFQTHRPTINELRICIDKNCNSMDTKEIQLNNMLNNYFITYSQSKYMAFNVFVINNKFLFVFLGSVITFTVMLIQLLTN